MQPGKRPSMIFGVALVLGGVTVDVTGFVWAAFFSVGLRGQSTSDAIRYNLVVQRSRAR